MQVPAADTNDVAALRAVITSLQQEVEHLRWQFAKARQERVGRRLADELPLQRMAT